MIIDGEVLEGNALGIEVFNEVNHEIDWNYGIASCWLWSGIRFDYGVGLHKVDLCKKDIRELVWR